MIHHPSDKATLVQMTDPAFRPTTPRRSVDQLTYILDVQGIPRFFSPLERTLLRGFQSFGGYLPGVAVPLVKERMQHETANVVLPAEPDELRDHLRARRDAGVRMNVNFLGEALLGEAESERRLQGYLQALQDPDIEVVSVKISTIFSQIDPIARAHTVATLCDRLELLYRASAKARFRRADGTEVAKFVYLDMEEYRDMSITADAFMQTLDWARRRSTGHGAELLTQITHHLLRALVASHPLRRFVAGDPELALRILMSRSSPVEQRSIAAVRALIATEADAGHLRPTMPLESLAYVIVRIAESFLFRDVITGEPPDFVTPTQAIGLLFTAQTAPARIRARTPGTSRRR